MRTIISINGINYGIDATLSARLDQTTHACSVTRGISAR